MNPLVLAFLLASGDAAAGRAIFHGKGGCVKCHSIENRGSVGPDLSEIGLRRTGGSLRLALVDPDAEIYEEYFTVVAVTKLGQRIERIALNEDDLLIAKRNLANVELALGGERGSGLPEGVADLVLMANAYHEFSEPEAMLRTVRRALSSIASWTFCLCSMV
jgi:putative heme-binding domain-containing protein